MGAKEECAKMLRLHAVSVAGLRSQLKAVTAERDKMRKSIKHLIGSYRGDEPVRRLKQILDGTYL